jgi:hypothetical protein
MKTTALISLAMSMALADAFGQTGNVPEASGGSAATLPASPYQVVSVGANNRTWQWETYETLPNGEIHTNLHSYEELASGLNYQDPSSGNWVAAQPAIEAFAGGAVARQSQHTVIFANNINTAGSIDAQMVDGTRLRSTVMGLMYSDATTGQAVQIAQLKDSEGELVAVDEVLYPDAFEGASADILYKNRIDGMEQNIVLKAQLPDPQEWGMNPATTYLGVFTELYGPPTPELQDLPSADPAVPPDQAISWGSTFLGRGKAFALGSATNVVEVIKRFNTTDGRYFLLEKVRYLDAQAALSELPRQASNVKPIRGLASRDFKFPPAPATRTAARPMRLALGARPAKGYVLDYTTLSTAYTNYTFQGDTTYYLSGTLSLAGVSNVFEGGCVLKYTNGTSINVASGGAAVFTSQPFHPVVFTARDDNAVGAAISGSTGSPSGYYANPALDFQGGNASQLSCFRIAYAQVGIINSGSSVAVNNAQLVNCQSGIAEVSGALTINNALFLNLATNLYVLNGSAVVNNATFANAGHMLLLTNSSPVYLTNSILANVTNVAGMAGSYNGFYQSPEFGSQCITNQFSPFQRVGAGSCYLTNGSAFLQAGTASVGSGVLALLTNRTTHPPIVYSNLSFSISTNFSPQVQRDASSTPDLGYHYDPLDYAFSGVSVYSNITFSAGTAAGWFELPGSGGLGLGLAIYDKVVLSFNGTASQPCTLARYSTVQEGGDGLWTTLGYMAGVVPESLSGGYSMNATNAAVIQVNFTRHALLAEGPNHYREYTALSQVVAQNSEFWGGGIGAYWDNLYATNCLFDRVGVSVQGSNPCQYWLRNCTMHGGSLTLDKFTGTWPVWIEECAFDGTTLAVGDNSDGNTNITYCDFNAFLTNATRLPILGTHDVVVTNFNWQRSWFGNYYQLTNSPLINSGSTTADKFGLYHFTVMTNLVNGLQIKETNSIVDRGYHYVATDAYGNPIDTNGDGIPDYIEDANGNGLVDSGEIGWNIVGDLGLQVIIAKPRNGSTIP